MPLMYLGSAAYGRKSCIQSELLHVQLLVSATYAYSELLHLNVLFASTLPQVRRCISTRCGSAAHEHRDQVWGVLISL